MNKIIVTMAGEESCFNKEEYKVPKHEIVVGGKTLFEWSMQSLSDFFEDEFIFVVREEAYDLENIVGYIEELGIKRYIIIELNEITRGQAETAYAATDYINDTDSVLISNMDAYINEFAIKQTDIKNEDTDGAILYFNAEGEVWPCINLNDNEEVREVTEKTRASNVSRGLYYFKSWADYKEIYRNYGNRIIEEYGEIYIAPMYGYLAENGKQIHKRKINEVVILGTPQEVKNFESIVGKEING